MVNQNGGRRPGKSGRRPNGRLGRRPGRSGRRLRVGLVEDLNCRN